MNDSQKWLLLAVSLSAGFLVYLLSPVLMPFMTAANTKKSVRGLKNNAGRIPSILSKWKQTTLFDAGKPKKVI